LRIIVSTAAGAMHNIDWTKVDGIFRQTAAARRRHRYGFSIDLQVTLDGVTIRRH